MTQSSINSTKSYLFGDFSYSYSNSELIYLPSKKAKHLEPKINDLLNILIHSHQEVVSKASLVSSLWPNTIVSEDTLARTVSRLRSELSDSASNPSYILTVPKRGYRFIQEISELSTSEPTKDTSLRTQKTFISVAVVVLLLIGGLFLIDYFPKSNNAEVNSTLSRADGLYMLFEEQSNEAALSLYEQVLEIDPSNAQASAGIANAMVQRVIRWPSKPYQINESKVSLSSALKSGRLKDPNTKMILERARLIAEKGVRQSPNNVQAIKSLGFVYSANGQLERAIAQYRRAIEIDNNAWRSLINLGELYALNGQDSLALKTFEKAYDAMQIKFSEEPQHIGPWQPELGNSIAKTYSNMGDEINTQSWANKVLSLVPFEREATTLLVNSLKRNKQADEAKLVCENYAKKLEPISACK